MTILRWIGVFSFVMLFSATSTQAEESYAATSYVDYSQFTSYMERIEELEAEVASMRQLSLGGDYGKLDAKGDGSFWKETYVGAEVAILRPHVSTLVADFDVAASPRFWVGRESSCGLGYRITGWYFNSELNIDLGGGTIFSNEMETYAIDLDVTQRANFSGWDLLVFGGIRVGGLENTLFFTDGVDTATIDYRFDSVGVTFGAGFDRQIGDTALSIFGNFRQSFLFGTASFGVVDTFIPIGAVSVDLIDQILSVSEINLGVQYEREASIGTIFARVAIEGQVWEVPPVILGIGDNNVGFFGAAFSLGVIR